MDLEAPDIYADQSQHDGCPAIGRQPIKVRTAPFVQSSAGLSARSAVTQMRKPLSKMHIQVVIHSIQEVFEKIMSIFLTDSADI